MGDTMIYRLGVDDIAPNHWIAWALDLPACYSSAKNSAEAMANAPRRIGEYFSWIRMRDPLLPNPPETVEVKVVETIPSRASRADPGYIVNAFFEDDRRPLSYWDIAIARRLLEWTHQDLLKVIAPLDDPQEWKTIPGERRGVIAEIIRHVAGAENWYFGQMGLKLEASLPDNPVRMLERVRKNTNERLWDLMADVRITEDRDELWSSRKVVRRALWHERDHTQHIRQLLGNS
jgi:hypothetical protein